MSAGKCYGAQIAANGIRQHYVRYVGAGRAMVVLPGITSPAATWGFVAERLAERFDTYILDIRGRGLSSSGPSLDYRLDALADDLVAFVRAIGLSDAVLLGHSMGGRIVARAMTRGADRIGQVVLVDPPVSGPGRRPYPSALNWYVDSIRAANAGMDAEGMRSFCPTWTDEQLALRAEWLPTCFEPAIVAAFEGFHTDDIHPDLRDLEVATLLLRAERGNVILDVDVDEIRRMNGAIAVRTVRDAGHMIPWDNIDGFIGALAEVESDSKSY